MTGKLDAMTLHVPTGTNTGKGTSPSFSKHGTMSSGRVKSGGSTEFVPFSDFQVYDADMAVQVCLLGCKGAERGKLLEAISWINKKELSAEERSDNAAVKYGSCMLTLENAKISLRCWEIAALEPCFARIISNAYIRTSNVVIFVCDLDDPDCLKNIETKLLPVCYPPNDDIETILPLDCASIFSSDTRMQNGSPSTQVHSDSGNGSPKVPDRIAVNSKSENNFVKVPMFSYGVALSPPPDTLVDDSDSFDFDVDKLRESRYNHRSDTTLASHPHLSNQSQSLSTNVPVVSPKKSFNVVTTSKKLIVLMGCHFRDDETKKITFDSKLSDADMELFRSNLESRYPAKVEYKPLDYDHIVAKSSDQLVPCLESIVDRALTLRLESALEKLNCLFPFADRTWRQDDHVRDAIMDLGFKPQHSWWIKLMPPPIERKEASNIPKYSNKFLDDYSLEEEELRNMRYPIISDGALASYACCTIS